MLQGWRTLIDAAKVERPEFGADGTAVGEAGHLDAVGDLSICPNARGSVCDEHNLSGRPHQDLDNGLNIAQSTFLPLLPKDVGADPVKTNDLEAVLEPLILPEIGQLCVDGDLVVDDSGQPSMVLFQDHDPVLEDAGCLGGDTANLVSIVLEGNECLLRAIEEMKDVLQPGVGSQVYPIWLIIWGGKAGQQEQVRGPLGATEDLREQAHDLGQPLPVPDWCSAIHRRRNQEKPGWGGSTCRIKRSSELLENWLDTSRDSGWPGC